GYRSARSAYGHLDLGRRGVTSAGTVTESNGSGSVADSHVYATAGIYQVTLTVTDQLGASVKATVFQDVVVYDPAAGSVTGRGRILSTPGTVANNPALTGKATFKLTARYAANDSVLSGQLVLKLKAAHLIFQSSELDWLVISGGTISIQGSGTL